MIQIFQRSLPNGITLSCRATGEAGRPLMVFLHGFPEAAFIWDELLEYFAQPEHGGYRCVAPNLRGFEQSSAPTEVAAYKAQLLIQDVQQLAATESADGKMAALVAHDWGGAFAWGYANAFPEQVGKLVIINSPHPGTFTRELRDNPAQQKASAYMNFLAQPKAEELLSADDYKRMWPFFTLMKAGPEGFGWLTDEVKQQYRDVWNAGLTGACNLYRVTPMKPALPGQPGPEIPTLPRERLVVNVPTFVFWALDDAALLPGLLEGLEDYVPKLEVKKVPNATHWIVHEQPQLVAREIEAFLSRN
ncbi:alpha/beta hydrolase [Variovorax sp. J22G21]|uniref:alpha/beta fold hydrolase n=1 Tax=Variovorax fucosicus TaxID=3053517 RepID=UPI0025787F10|nr:MULTISPECIES: alpha/beta hydrolase [unclassified Variovorax]MDM0038217.1 alpha/beta hydrolase [Variovorax sp. J22R193]MDM0062993.1 alpha/beta hydrolase [Variovorax sp. J22G21]